jgi:hypothetical protein
MSSQSRPPEEATPREGTNNVTENELTGHDANANNKKTRYS